MERQLELDLADVEERQRRLRVFLKPLKLPDRQVAVLCLMIGHGERGESNGQQTGTIQISKHKAGKLAGVSGNTFVEGVRDLEAVGLMAVLQITRPCTYVVNWTRVGKLEPPPVESLESHPLVSEVWSAPVSLGQAPRAFVDTRKRKTRGSRVPCNRATEDRTEPDQVPMPWSSDDGLSNAELHEAVASRNVPLLRHMFYEAVQTFGLADTPHNKMLFLSFCHHVVTAKGIRSPMAVLQQRVKNGLAGADRLAHAHCEWARGILNGRPRGRDSASGTSPELQAVCKASLKELER